MIFVAAKCIIVEWFYLESKDGLRFWETFNEISTCKEYNSLIKTVIKNINCRIENSLEKNLSGYK